MRTRPDESSVIPRSPARVFLLVLLLVFAAEGAIMIALSRLPRAWRDPMVDSLLDASVLTLVMAPAVWFLAVLPLRRSFEARGRLLRQLFTGQEQERARVARDLHDGVGQHLTALMVGLRGLEDGVAAEAPSAGVRARELRDIAALAHAEVRALARGLRPVLLEELGLVLALERLCQDFERSHGFEVTWRCDAATIPRFDAASETALYRIAQEALTNVARHAGAKRVCLSLAREGASIALEIHDDGRGFDAQALKGSPQRRSGFGLGSMRERARLVGGELVVRRRAEAGTAVEVHVPIQDRGQRA